MTHIYNEIRFTTHRRDLEALRELLEHALPGQGHAVRLDGDYHRYVHMAETMEDIATAKRIVDAWAV